ncbi:DUF3368 domain-containing protein [Clostridium sp. MCC353]|uniref:DUF3368 domain-containing protein n=1 Tax=Clostridium sp. MCC353 TaxID=2592646 RepID=UPI001C01FC0B|nr:DUF3368 domain-containing protein [Clostridium sp. MCC353]MBT9779731.1 DUF3368 domain-containing protein [Clostridium sp. MCC353]
MIIIPDTTPIISLIKAGHLELLYHLFTEVMIPEAVYLELTSNTAFEKEAEVVRHCSFIKVQKVTELKSVSILRKVTGLDAGESEAIVLAEETNAQLLLMDEHKGRRVARQMGITITGTVGILLQAYDENLILGEEVELCLLKMRDCGIRIGNELQKKVFAHIKKGN